jgi:hypothetical protein
MNMKSALLTVAALGFMAMPALAQTAPAGGAPAAPAQGDFQQHKADMLAHIQKAEACVQAATDEQALEACRPNRGGHGGHAPAQ